MIFFYTCSQIEFICRMKKLHRAKVVEKLGFLAGKNFY